MSLVEQIQAQALVLIQDSTDVNLPMLGVFCRSAENSLRQKLREAGAMIKTVRNVGYRLEQ